MMGHIYSAPYAKLCPDVCFVAEDEMGVAGFVVGAVDTRSFEERLERDWWPDLREIYHGGSRVQLETDTNGDGRADIVQLLDGDAVTQQDEDTDFDGVLNRRFLGNTPADIPPDTSAPAKYGALQCGRFDAFWKR